MKSNKIGIKWKIFGYMTVFSVFILGLLWVFQILLLTPFYRYIKIEQTKAYARTVTDHIDDGSLQELLRELTHQNSMCIRV
ncbi:MAG: two-component sensor histidine kinase, partial [Oscillospiraceae bacterium]|nr:two-component sensor histidine kinase [Oscillospiraceae bacterium]